MMRPNKTGEYPFAAPPTYAFTLQGLLRPAETFPGVILAVHLLQIADLHVVGQQVRSRVADRVAG
jgi:hypothetical protein